MKKGFTLIELMGVIAILMLILLLAIPAVTKVISTSEKTIYDIQIDRILNAAYDYSLENINVLPERNQKSYVSLAELIYNDYIDRLVNPNTKEFFPDDYLISIENVGKNRSNGSKYSKKSGSYIYKVEYDEMSEAEYTSNKPKIYLESTGGNELTRVDDSYTTIMNQDAVFEENNYVVKVYDKDDNDITDNVKLIRNVVFNDESTDTIDTSKIGIYKIIYVALINENNKAYAGKTTWNIIIRDTESPELTIPSNSTITTSTETLDLMEGVSCTDNSGNCEVKLDGIVNYGTIGVYTITYTATDAAGNKSTKQRIITIE